MIKKLRKREKLTQKELAQKCNITQSYLSQLENKFYNPTVRQIICLATELKINVIHLSSWFIIKELEQQAEKMEFPIDEDEED